MKIIVSYNPKVLFSGSRTCRSLPLILTVKVLWACLDLGQALKDFVVVMFLSWFCLSDICKDALWSCYSFSYSQIGSLFLLSSLCLIFWNDFLFQRMSQSEFTEVIIEMVCICKQTCLERICCRFSGSS